MTNLLATMCGHDNSELPAAKVGNVIATVDQVGMN